MSYEWNETMRRTIDAELADVFLSETRKEMIRGTFGQTKERGRHFSSRVALVFVLIFALGTATALGGYWAHSQTNVNRETLPELDAMKIIAANPISGQADQYGLLEKEADSYEAAMAELGVSLLTSPLASTGESTRVTIETDNQCFAEVQVDHFIIGDVTNVRYDAEIDDYRYTPGNTYYSPVTLTAALILNQEQLEIGWNVDYLGLYTYQESYRSPQGYQVNLISDTTGDGVAHPAGFQSEKCAVFVADGVYYTLKGRVSTETMKEIIAGLAY